MKDLPTLNEQVTPKPTELKKKPTLERIQARSLFYADFMKMFFLLGKNDLLLVKLVHCLKSHITSQPARLENQSALFGKHPLHHDHQSKHWSKISNLKEILSYNCNSTSFCHFHGTIEFGSVLNGVLCNCKKQKRVFFFS